LSTVKLLFSVIAAFPIIASFCLYMSHFDIANPSVFTGTVTLFVYLLMSEYSRKISRIVTAMFYGPILFAVSVLILYGDPVPITGLGVGYMLLLPIVLFLGALSESPRGMLTIYFYAYVASLLILATVMGGAETPQSLYARLAEFFVGILSVRVVPFYPVVGFVFFWQILTGATALGAVGLAFLASYSPKSFIIKLQDYTGIVKAVLASMAITFVVAILSAGSPSAVTLLMEALALALSIIVFKVSRRA